jgi:hypothetical protein
MSFNHMRLVRIDAPEWYQREDWMAWLNNRTPMNHPATWHVEGEKPNEYSDVFFTFCQGEGSDYGEGKPSIPKDIWYKITKTLAQQGIE